MPPLPKAQLIGVLLESLLYGTYLVIFIQCIQVLQRRRSRPSDYLLGTAVSLFILVTAHLVIDLIRTIDAFTSHMETPNYPVTYYSHPNTWQGLSRSAVYVTTTVISDAFIMYRAFILWRRSYLVVAIPFMSFLADTAIGILWVYTITLATPEDNVFTFVLNQRAQVFYGITLGMNIICTSLIAYKIWKTQRNVASHFKSGENEIPRLVAIIIESGSVYSAALVAMIATSSRNSTAMFILLSTMCPTIGIVFSSVIVRVGSGLSHGDSYTTGSHATATRAQWATRLSGRQTGPDQQLTFPERGLQVALSHTVHTQIDRFPAEEFGTDSGGINSKSQLDTV